MLYIIKIMKNSFKFSFIILLCLHLESVPASVAFNTKKVKVVITSKATLTFSDLEKKGLKKKLRIISRIDPTSKTEHNYSGYLLSDFVRFIQNSYHLKKIDHIETIAKDGYKVVLNKKSLTRSDAFIAFDISNVGKKGLYNHSLKTHFKWEPSYIIFNTKKNKTSISSPYQVTKMIIYENKERLSILDKVHSTKKNGVKVFIRSCSKCHAYKGFGGKKAPKMSLVIKRWKRKDNKKLKSFLRNPQQTLKRKIQMSPYTGSEKDLDYLIEFLRTI